MIRRAGVLPCVVAVTCVCAAWLSARACGLPLGTALAVVAPTLLVMATRTLAPVWATRWREGIPRVPPPASAGSLTGPPSSCPAAEAGPPRRGARYHRRSSPPRLLRRH